MMLHSHAVAIETKAKRYPELAGKRVLVAGAERGFGLAIAKAFARHQSRLVLQAARRDGANRIDCTALSVFECRPQSEGELERLVDAAAAAHAGLDIAIAVTALPRGWRDMLADDPEAPAAQALRLPFLAGRCIAERMRLKNIRGTLLTVAALPANASAARTLLAAALTTLVSRQNEELGPYGIRAYGIAAEPMICPAGGPDDDRAGPAIARTGRSRTVAEAALMLASDRGMFLSGQTLTI
jgi:NAD(P)-dependent dehydrogenase (short-subunit alcohol dehydrogenase family)